MIYFYQEFKNNTNLFYIHWFLTASYELPIGDISISDLPSFLPSSLYPFFSVFQWWSSCNITTLLSTTTKLKQVKKTTGEPELIKDDWSCYHKRHSFCLSPLRISLTNFDKTVDYNKCYFLKIILNFSLQYRNPYLEKQTFHCSESRILHQSS